MSPAQIAHRHFFLGLLWRWCGSSIFATATASIPYLWSSCFGIHIRTCNHFELNNMEWGRGNCDLFVVLDIICPIYQTQQKLKLTWRQHVVASHDVRKKCCLKTAQQENGAHTEHIELIQPQPSTCSSEDVIAKLDMLSPLNSILLIRIQRVEEFTSCAPCSELVH